MSLQSCGRCRREEHGDCCGRMVGGKQCRCDHSSVAPAKARKQFRLIGSGKRPRGGVFVPSRAKDDQTVATLPSPPLDVGPVMTGDT